MITLNLSRNAKSWRYLTIALAIGYVCVLISYTAPIAMDPDQCSYFAAAHYLADDGTFYYKDKVEFEAVGNFFINVKDKFYPVYPPGYPLALAATIIVFGAGAEYYFTIFCAGLVVFMMYAFSRLFLPRLYAFLGAFLLAASPTFFFNAQIKNTHTFGLLLTLVALYALLATARNLTKTIKISKFEIKWSIAGAAICGFLLAYNVIVHYTEIVLFLVPLAYVLTARNLRQRWKLLAAGIGGAVLPFLWLAWWQNAHFGSPFKTGYSFFTGASNNFTSAWILRNIWLYFPGMCNYGFGIAGGVLALAVWLKFRGVKTTPNWFWLAWILPLGIAYHFYFWSSPDRYQLMLRFWEPFFPALIVVGLIGLRRVLRDGICVAPAPLRVRGKNRRQRLRYDSQTRISPKLAAGGLIGFIAMQFFWGVTFSVPEAEGMYSWSQYAYRHISIIKQQVPRDALLFTAEPEYNPVQRNELIQQHRWRVFSENVFQLENFQKAVRINAENTDRVLGKDVPRTSQSLNEDRLRAMDADVVSARFYKLLRDSAAAGVPMYYVGNVNTYPRFQELAGQYFEMKEPYSFDDFRLNYLLFPRGVRVAAVVPPVRTDLPKMLIVPLRLKDENPRNF